MKQDLEDVCLFSAETPPAGSIAAARHAEGMSTCGELPPSAAVRARLLPRLLCVAIVAGPVGSSLFDEQL